MNSRYTYKAKRKDNGEWVYGFLIIYASGNVKITIPICRKDLQKLSNTIYGSYEIIPETLCQCTGLQDRDGKDIFENDILEVPLFIEEYQKAICIYNEEHNVNDIIGFGLYTYDNHHQRYSKLVQSDEWDEFKIIGNKFDKEED